MQVTYQSKHSPTIIIVISTTSNSAINYNWDR